MSTRFVILAITAVVPELVLAQDSGSSAQELPPLLPEREEIALAMSAAPPEISKEASILVLERGGYVEAREGSNGFTCFVDHIFPQSVEPICFNAEGSTTILQLQLLRSELREKGFKSEEIEARVEAAFSKGELRLPSKLAIAYMFSSAQDIYSDSGTRHGQYRPHMMIYSPYITNADIGVTRRLSSPSYPVVWRSGLRDAAIIVIVPEFVDPDPELQNGS